MTIMGWPVVEVVARLLESDERNAVLGDLKEARETTWDGMFGVLGLVFRRQAELWKSWRPWLAGFGLALPSSLLLMGASLTAATPTQVRIAQPTGNRRAHKKGRFQVWTAKHSFADGNSAMGIHKPVGRDTFSGHKNASVYGIGPRRITGKPEGIDSSVALVPVQTRLSSLILWLSGMPT
jgi:hypothetical protein